MDEIPIFPARHRARPRAKLQLRALAVAALLCAPSPAAAQTLTFADTKLGSRPADFEFLLTGRGQPGRWEVVEDATAAGGRALAQLGADRTDYRFPLAVYTGASAANVEIAARFKPVSGTVDRSGGVVVRLTDANNYYIARANALEDNVRFYRVVNGRRQQLANADTKVASGQWHLLALRAVGDRFTVSFDGKPVITATDRTFRGPGKAGLWTKADSVTHFDRIEIEALP
jgi:hypothetical protein